MGALIGWFALGNARIYQHITDLQSALINIKAVEVMNKNFRVVNADLTLSQFANKYLLKSYKFSTYFATSMGRYLGLVSTDAIPYIEKSYRDTQSLRMIICPLNHMLN